MRLTFRGKLTTIVAIDALALLGLVLASAFIDRQVDQQLLGIRQRYVPRIGLTQRLEASFERVGRTYQDAVAASEPDLLADADRHYATLLAELDAAGEVITPDDRARLRAALDTYDRAAAAVTRKLLADTGGEALVGEMQAMQVRRTEALDLLREVTRFDEAALAQAFASVSAVRHTGARIRLVVSGLTLVTILALSLWIGRDLVRRVATLVAGLARFGSGDFRTPIPALAGDELGTVALHANEMAASLQRLDDETQALLRTTQRQATELVAANRELDAFAYSVSHDLKAPLRAIDGFSEILIRDYAERLDDKAREHLGRVRNASQRMGQLIEDLLQLSRASRGDLRRAPVDLSALAASVVAELRRRTPQRVVEVEIAPGLTAHGDARLLRIVLENLLGNSWKFTRDAAAPRISFTRVTRDDRPMFAVVDNGAGFDMAYVGKLFAPFQRLHALSEFEGTGIGLATVQRVIARHGGEVRAEGQVGRGATILFSIAEGPA